ncbi:MAG TPA: hypothetical protein VGF28_01110 [Thermoanaerobaculia bacterium]
MPLIALLVLSAAAACADEPMRREIVARHTEAFAVGDEPVIVTVDVAPAKRQLARAAEAATEMVVLQVEGVDAERAPGFLAEVVVAGEPVGTVALYAFRERQDFVFEVDAPLAALLRKGSTTVEVRFVPVSGLENEPARPAAPIRISGLTLFIERQ